MAAITPTAFSGVTLAQLAAISPLQAATLKQSQLLYLTQEKKSLLQSKMVGSNSMGTLFQAMAAST